MSVALGDHDAFFPVDKLRQSCRAKLGLDPVVVPHAGHLLVSEEPELVSELVRTLF